jgi:hypothetical protein
MFYSEFWSGAKKGLNDLANCASIAIIGASPGFMLYELNFPEKTSLSIAITGTALAEIAYVAYSNKIIKALGL